MTGGRPGQGEASERRARLYRDAERGRSGADGKGDKQGLFARMGLFYRQVVAELRKVIWPTRSELVTYTVVVMFFVRR